MFNTETDTLEFPDWNAFLQWKERIEAETFTSYTMPKGSVCGKDEGIYSHSQYI